MADGIASGSPPLDAKALSRRARLLDELRGRLRAIDYGCIPDPSGQRREELCAAICRHQQPLGVYRSRPLPPQSPPGVIGFGVPFELRDLASGETVFCQIACPPDSASRHTLSSSRLDPQHHRICCTSPAANALLGHRKGETVEIHGGTRTMRYEILEVESLFPPL